MEKRVGRRISDEVIVMAAVDDWVEIKIEVTALRFKRMEEGRWLIKLE